EDVIAFCAEAVRQLEAVESSGERQAALRKEVTDVAAAYRTAAGSLSVARKAAAQKLARKAAGELASLAMENTRVEIRVSESEWSASGTDAVEILISPNVGEEPKPLEKIASGGNCRASPWPSRRAWRRP